eukprot:scaffold6226_cov118-Cylindrotheca_fusiformis.AAC.3
MKPPEPPSGKERTIVGISFKIAETELECTADLNLFSKHVNDTFSDFYGGLKKKSTKEERFNAPYFPFIQSSGMGKTKILYHYAEANPSKKRWELKHPGETRAPSNDKYAAILILCRKKRSDPEEPGSDDERVFEEFIDFEGVKKHIDGGKKSFSEAYESFMEELLDLDIRIEQQERKVVLLFDESHFLLSSVKLRNGEEPALLFRLIRLFLLKKRNKEVMAVFTGTSGGLRNYRKIDLPKAEPSNSRDVQVADPDLYARGSKVFKEFFSLTTIGCLQNKDYSSCSFNKDNGCLWNEVNGRKVSSSNQSHMVAPYLLPC